MNGVLEILGLVAIGAGLGGLLSALLNRYMRTKTDPFMCGCGHHAAFHGDGGEGKCTESDWDERSGYIGVYQKCLCKGFQPKDQREHTRTSGIHN